MINREVHEKDLDYIQYPENPEEVDKRAMEKLSRKIKFADAYLEVWYEREEDNEGENGGNPHKTEFSVKIRDVLEKNAVSRGLVHGFDDRFVQLGKTPEIIVKLALKELENSYGVKRLGREWRTDDFILQIAGKKVFVTREAPITQFEYIRSCFENYRIPKLLLRKKRQVFKEYSQPLTLFEVYTSHLRHISIMLL